jgi:hypothetical protein
MPVAGFHPSVLVVKWTHPQENPMQHRTFKQKNQAVAVMTVGPRPQEKRPLFGHAYHNFMNKANPWLVGGLSLFAIVEAGQGDLKHAVWDAGTASFAYLVGRMNGRRM